MTANNDSTARVAFEPRGRLIDFHSHMLPAIDDGSRSTDESLEMLRLSVDAGVCAVILTPHFYATEDSPDVFLAHRARALESLRNRIESPFPILLTGAEVFYFEGIVAMAELEEMRIEKTRLLLLEMPFRRWQDRVIDDALILKERFGHRVVVAHVERYIDEQPRGTLEVLRDNGLLIQSNAEFFLDRRTRRRALKMLAKGQIDLIGSDAHNTTSRPPNLGDAYSVIREELGDRTANGLIERGYRLLLEDARASSAS